MLGGISMTSWIRIPDERGPELRPGPQFSRDSHELHSSSSMSIIAPKTAIELPRARHYHNSYEFLFPLETMDNCYIGNRIVSVPAYHLMPFNPDQLHGASEPGRIRFLSIMLTGSLMQGIAASAGFKSNVEFLNESISVDPEFHALVNTFISESKGQQLGYEAILQSLAAEITVYLMRHLPGNLDPYRFKRNIPNHSKIQQAVQYIEANFSKEFSISSLAALVGLSPWHFIRLFKERTGVTPHNYIIRFRITQSQAMLLRKDASITEVCFSSGFTSPSHFSAVFKQITGMAPSEYRKAVIR